MVPGTRVRFSKVPSNWPASTGVVVRPSLWARLLRRWQRLPLYRDTLVVWDGGPGTPVWCDPTELRAVADQPASRAR